MRIWIVVLLLIAACCPDVLAQKKGPKTQEMKFLYAFPKETDEAFLAQPEKLSLVGDMVYISDYNLRVLLKFRTDGTFVKQIGSKGQAPGEFATVISFAYSNGYIYQIDNNNGRIQIFDQELQYQKSFKLLRVHIEDVAAHNGKIYVVDTGEIDAFTKNEGLIVVYDEKGRIVNRFGDIFTPNPKRTLPRGTSSATLDIYDKRLYLLADHYPMLRIFTLDGKLLKTLEFEENNKQYKAMVPRNYDVDALTKDPIYIPTQGLFKAVDVNEYGIFMGLFSHEYKGYTIDHYDHNGQFKQRYVYHGMDMAEYYLADFAVASKQVGKFTFYILDHKGIPRVSVFEATVPR